MSDCDLLSLLALNFPSSLKESLGLSNSNCCLSADPQLLECTDSQIEVLKLDNFPLESFEFSSLGMLKNLKTLQFSNSRLKGFVI